MCFGDPNSQSLEVIRIVTCVVTDALYVYVYIYGYSIYTIYSQGITEAYNK